MSNVNGWEARVNWDLASIGTSSVSHDRRKWKIDGTTPIIIAGGWCAPPPSMDELLPPAEYYSPAHSDDGSSDRLAMRHSARKRVHFTDTVQWAYTYSGLDYDRRPLFMIPLTEHMAELIRRELNALKHEMEVHVDSQHLTHFYRAPS